jgi:hypothetical protein
VLDHRENTGRLDGVENPEHSREYEKISIERRLAIDAAYRAGRDAIAKSLGVNASQDELVDVVQLMAHSVLTQTEVLGIAAARHKTAVFCETLRALVERTQTGCADSMGCGRLM